MATPMAPASLYRDKAGLGVWEHRGKVAAVGIGHSPIDRRWDLRPETSIGAYTLIAIQKALDDAGVKAEDVDGLVVVPTTTTASLWSPRPIPEDFARTFKLTDNPDDGITAMSAAFIVANMPELKNVKTAFHSGGCMSNAIVVAAQVVGSGMANVCLVVRGWDNLPGRYHANPTVAATGNSQWSDTWGFNSAGTPYAYAFQKYCEKYGSNHDRMAPFIVNQRRNGLMFPEGFYAQHEQYQITVEDYLNARWLCKPLCLFDADRPVQTAAAYVFATADRAKDMKQTPVYILNHSSHRPRSRSSVQSLEEIEASTDMMAQLSYEGSGLTPRDIDVFNPYDGYTLFTQYYLEAYQWHGVKRGEAHDFYAGNITVEGPHPFSSSGGNSGNGRTRFWMHTDCIQQLQGRAGQRQVHIKAETAISGGPTPGSGDWTVWSKNPD